MITRTLESFFRNKKKQPIRTEKKNKHAILNVLELEERALPSANSFVPGDLIVYTATSNSASGAPVVLGEYSPTLNALIQQVSTGIYANATSSTEGGLNLSSNGLYSVVPGYQTQEATGNVNVAANARVVALVDTYGNVTTTSLGTTGWSTANIRSADSDGNGNIWAASSSQGVLYASTSNSGTDTAITGTGTINDRFLNISGGQLYVDSSSGTGAGSGSGAAGTPLYYLGTVGTGEPTTAGNAVTSAPGFPTTSGSGSYQFAFASATTVYIADSNTSGTGANGGGIQKWTYNGSAWVFQYNSLPATGAGLYDVGVSSNGAIFGVTTAGNLVAITDTGSATTGFTFSTVATAPAAGAFRGVAGVPSVPSLTTTSEATPTSSTNNPLTNTNFTLSATTTNIPNGQTVYFEAIENGVFTQIGSGTVSGNSVTTTTANFGNTTGTFNVVAYYPGSQSLSLTASYSATPKSLTVGTPTAPTLTSTNDTVPAYLPFSFQMTATGAPSTFTYSSTNLPSGLFLSASGLLSGNASQSETFNVTVSNGVAPNYSGNFTLNVTAGFGAKASNSANVESTGPYNGTSYDDLAGTSGAFPSFVVDDVAVSARPDATAIGSLTFEVPEHYFAGTDTGGTVDLFLATGTGNTVFYSSLKDTTTATGYGSIDTQLNAVGLDSGNAPIGQASYTPAAASTGLLTFTISASTLSANPNLTADLLSDLQTGLFRFVLAADTASTSYELAGSAYVPAPAVNLTYTPGAQPYITSPNSASFNEGTAGQTFQVTADGTAPITFSVDAGGNPLPAGLSMNSAGLISGTPTVAGTFSGILLDANNAVGPQNQQMFTMTVVGPKFTSADGVGVPYNTAANFQFATAPAATSFSVTGGTLPGTMSLSSSGLLTGSTTSVGEYPITVTAVTPNGNVSETFYISALPQSGTTTHFQPGDLVVYTIGNGTAALSTTVASAVYLDEFSPGGILFQAIPLPTAVSGSNNPLTEVAGYGATGFLTDSGDGHVLLVTGQDAAAGATGLSATTGAQTIAEIGYGGTVNTTTVDTNSGGAVRSAATDGSSTNIWEATSTGGVRLTTLGTVGASTSINTTGASNVRVVTVVNGNLYVSSDSGSNVGINQVGTGLPTTGAAMNLLPGFTASDFPGTGGANGPYEYWFTTLSPSDTSPDTLYLASEANGIQKFTLENSGANAGLWEPNGQINGDAGNNEIQGITGTVNATTGAVTLYVTNGVYSAATGGYIALVTDTSGYNGTISGAGTSIAAATQIATAGTNTQFTSIALVPTDYADVAPIFVAPSPTTATSTTFVTTVPNSYQVLTQTASTDTVAQFNSGAGGYSATGLPSGVTISPTTGLISGTPLAGDTIGNYNVTIHAQNNMGTTTNTNLTINLIAAAAPSFTSTASTTFLAGINNVFNVTATGEPTTISYSASTGTGQTGLPSTVTLSSAGVLKGVPTADGVYTFTITANNGVAPNASQSFTLTVNGIVGTPTTSATVRTSAVTPSVVGLTGTAPNQTWNTTNLDPEGTSQGANFAGFALVDEQLPATPAAASLNSVTFQVNETTQFVGTAGTIELWIATGTGVSASIPNLVSYGNYLNNTLFDPSLDYAGADGVGGTVPLATVSYTPSRGNAMLNFTINFNSNGMIGSNSDTTAYNTILSALQAGTKVRLLLETSISTLNAGLSGAGATPPTGDVAPGVSINANLLTVANTGSQGAITLGPSTSNTGQNVHFGVAFSSQVPTGESVTLWEHPTTGADVQIGTGTLGAGGLNGEVVINYAFPTAGTYQIYAKYAGDGFYLPAQSTAVTQTVQNSATAVTLSYVDINSDANDTAIYDGGIQRSMVNTVVYHFDHAVNLSNSAIQITLHSGVTITLGNGQQSSGTVGIVPSPVDNSGNGTTWSTPDGGFTWVITFGGAGVTGGGSIADGVYDIKLLAAAVTTASGGAVVLTPSNNDGSGNDTETFWCLYGDSNQDQKVTAQDYSQFSSTYLARSINNAYIAWFDQQGDDKVTAQDYSAFASNYLKKYSGFSATI